MSHYRAKNTVPPQPTTVCPKDALVVDGICRQEIRENSAHSRGKAGPAQGAVAWRCNPGSELEEQQCLAIAKAAPATEAPGKHTPSKLLVH